MIQTTLLFLSLLWGCQGQTLPFCDKYCNITDLQASNWLRPIFNYTYESILLPGHPLHEYFNGTKPPGSTNYVGNYLRYIFMDQTTRLVASSIGCSDGSIPPYTGFFGLSHEGKQTNYLAYYLFNTEVCNQFDLFLSPYTGYDPTDLSQVGQALDLYRAYTCVEPDCFSLCNKYSRPCVRTNHQFVQQIISELFNVFNASSANYSNQTLQWAESYIGDLLTCSDGSIGPETGPNVTSILETLCLNNATFGYYLVLVNQALGNIGVSAGDIQSIKTLLEPFRQIAVSDCNKRSIRKPSSNNNSLVVK